MEVEKVFDAASDESIEIGKDDTRGLPVSAGNVDRAIRSVDDGRSLEQQGVGLGLG
jgi:hypothetical protein